MATQIKFYTKIVMFLKKKLILVSCMTQRKSLSKRKYGPEKTPYLDTFDAVK